MMHQNLNASRECEMAYYTPSDLEEIGFAFVGANVQISRDAKIYEPEKISIGANSRIDDLCILSGQITIGRFCHITPMCLIAGGAPGVFIDDFVTMAYGVKVFSQSDDYSGRTMVNSLIPAKYKNEYLAEVIIEKQVVIGANATIMPGVKLSQGSAIGAMSLVLEQTQPWTINVGVPSRFIKKRHRDLERLERDFLNEYTI